MNNPELVALLKEITEHLATVTGSDSRPDSDTAELVARARELLAANE